MRWAEVDMQRELYRYSTAKLKLHADDSVSAADSKPSFQCARRTHNRLGSSGAYDSGHIESSSLLRRASPGISGKWCHTFRVVHSSAHVPNPLGTIYGPVDTRLSCRVHRHEHYETIRSPAARHDTNAMEKATSGHNTGHSSHFTDLVQTSQVSVIN